MPVASHASADYWEPNQGATPDLTRAKHVLREWIESRLGVVQWNGGRWNPDPTVLQERLNDELTRADLICTTESKVECAPWRDRGFLERVALDMKRGISLIVRTGVALPSCGYDESAYAYEQNGSQRRKFWQSEQDDYREGKYSPQTLRAVRISVPERGRTDRLILTLGAAVECESNWHDVYYRVWTPKGGNEPVLLLSGSQMAYIDAPIQGSVTPDGVLFEYVIKKGKLERADPVALGPQDFTAFWLRHPWPESSRWTAVASRSQLQQWRKQHQRGPIAKRRMSKPTRFTPCS